MQKITDLHHALQSQTAEVTYRQKQYERFKQLEKERSISSEILDEAQQRLAIAKAKLAELEAQIPGLLGKVAHAAEGDVIRVRKYLAGELKIVEYSKVDLSSAQMIVHGRLEAGPLADKIRKALQVPIKVDYKDMTFDAILKDLAKKVEGLSFRNLFERSGGPSKEKMNLLFDQALPVSAILQALADETGCTFVVREYGILAIASKNAPPERSRCKSSCDRNRGTSLAARLSAGRIRRRRAWKEWSNLWMPADW